MTPLCKLAYKYKTDKCPQIKHSYTPFYYELLKDKDIKKVLELGIAKGGSLRMWRDFFPKAQIYGLDIVEETLIQEERITSYLCDETKEKDLRDVIKKIGSDIDLFIDDGSHRSNHQIFAAKILRPLLKNAIYIIEDVKLPGTLKRKLNVEIPALNRKYRIKKYSSDRLAIVNL